MRTVPVGFISPGHLLVALFVLVLGWSLVDATGPHRGVRGRVDCLWHAAMSAAMIVMVLVTDWAIPATFWTLLFGAGTAWFAVAAVRLLRAGPWGAGAGRVRVSGVGSAGVAAGHAVMCALMVGMAWVMELMGHTGAGAGAHGPGPAGSGGLGSAGSGHSAAHHGEAMTIAGTADPQAWLQLACLVGAAVLLWLGAGMLVGHVRNARRGRASAPATGSLLASLAMAAGMAVAFVQMI